MQEGRITYQNPSFWQEDSKILGNDGKGWKYSQDGDDGGLTTTGRYDRDIDRKVLPDGIGCVDNTVNTESVNMFK